MDPETVNQLNERHRCHPEEGCPTRGRVVCHGGITGFSGGRGGLVPDAIVERRDGGNNGRSVVSGDWVVVERRKARGALNRILRMALSSKQTQHKDSNKEDHWVVSYVAIFVCEVRKRTTQYHYSDNGFRSKTSARSKFTDFVEGKQRGGRMGCQGATHRCVVPFPELYEGGAGAAKLYIQGTHLLQKPDPVSPRTASDTMPHWEGHIPRVSGIPALRGEEPASPRDESRDRRNGHDLTRGCVQ